MSSDEETCRVCGEPFNHVLRNGYRNRFGQDVAVEICTDRREIMYVHVVNGEVEP